MKLLKGDTPEVMVVQILRGLMEASQARRDQRWQMRYDGIHARSAVRRKSLPRRRRR